MRRLLVVLVALLIVVPIAEISLIVYVGKQLGYVPTVLFLVGAAIAGSVLLRQQGRSAWKALREATAAGRTPAAEAVEGVLVLVGGLLMMLPGFVTDVLGLALVLPWTRRPIGRLVLARLVRRLPPSVATDLLGPKRVKARRGPAQGGGDVPTEPLPPRQGPRVIEGEIER